MAEITSYLESNKQIYKCRNCNKKFTVQSNIVNFRNIISNNVKLAILNCAKEMMSKSLIARFYIDLLKKWFPTAKIIIDLFHIVQLLTKSLNKVRIIVMNENKKNRNKYKRYWRFILKSRFDLNNSSWNNFRCFKKLMTKLMMLIIY